MTTLFRPAALALLGASMVLPQSQPNVEQRVETLLQRMTIDEKIGQMSQSTSMATLTDAIRQEIRAGRWGSFLNAGSPADRAEAQRIAVHESRLHIPLLFGRDVIHGYRTIFPIPLAQAASWDAELVEQASRIAAVETTREGIRWTFAPMMDIARDPRWGRVAESLGEDPYLASKLAVAMVHGLQGKSLDDAASVAACAKHFVGYGAAEGGRDYNSAWIPEILLRSVYLQPFRAARDAGVATFMTSFNTINGVPATGNRFVMHDILREEWQYDGMVVSDYNAIIEMIPHGFAADERDAARKAVQAGVDMEMVSTSYHDHLKELLNAGEIHMPQIDDAVRNILRLKFRLGLFDKAAAAPADAHPTPESLAVAERLATESAVLLKNRGHVLPLNESLSTIAVIGPLADSPADQVGTWSMDARTEDVRTPLAALRALIGAERVRYAPGLKNSRDTSHEGFAAAVDAARQADAVVLFLGEEAILSGEARSRAFLDLPGAQEALVEAVKATGKPLVTVIMAGRPLTFNAVADKADAVLYAWHAGTMGGPAIAKLLLGQSAPSGRLPITFPRTVGQVPIYYSHLSTGRPPAQNEEGVPVGNPAEPAGYTSKYIDVDFTPAYPFGYGLGYTDFEYANLRISAPEIRTGQTITASADITNRGSREGTEVVQFYTQAVTASVAQPVRILKAFERLSLKPGETRHVTFTLAVSDLAFYDSNKRLVTEPGMFHVWIAPDAMRGLEGHFKVGQAVSPVRNQ
ncbi:MAG TPA: glycoside hydrolase family 3 N-terminal domain-containing protein [Bryobacteraceae bacterium]|nr:glycoside hydrolase family 3 N-terminal domain-containing protein [Bryobacteraceae bacterium]